MCPTAVLWLRGGREEQHTTSLAARDNARVCVCVCVRETERETKRRREGRRDGGRESTDFSPEVGATPGGAVGLGEVWGPGGGEAVS